MRERPVVTTLSLVCAGNVGPTCMGAKTGHNMEKDVSCLFHYFSVDLPLLVPGNLVLGGWAAIPHGKLGVGPKAPSMAPLVYFSRTPEELALVVNGILRFEKGFTPPKLYDGALRPFADAMAATLIMYYEESMAAHEIAHVCLHMRQCLMKLKMAKTDEDAHQTLIRWGAEIMVGHAHVA